jgi:hypothetical protein
VEGKGSERWKHNRIKRAGEKKEKKKREKKKKEK